MKDEYSVEPTGAVRRRKGEVTGRFSDEESQTYHLHRIATALERIAEVLDHVTAANALNVRTGP